MLNLIFKIERYKWNSEYGVYVSNLGHFKDRHKRRIPAKINNNGYVLIETEMGFKLAHRLVLLTWKKIPNAEEMTVDHLDHNKRNNEINNLEWVTLEENRKRANEDFLSSVKECLNERKNKYYYIYSKDLKLLYYSSNIDDIIKFCSVYYPYDFAQFREYVENKKTTLEKEISDIATSTKALQNKKIGINRIEYR